jgi:hypothetical protein
MGGDPDLIEIRFSGMDSTIERLDWERHRIEPQHCFEVQKISFKKYTRMVNHIIAYLDRITVYDRVRLDDLTVIERLDSFTLAQILQFIDIASDAAATNVLPALLDYRNSHYPDYADYGDLTLDI